MSSVTQGVVEDDIDLMGLVHLAAASMVTALAQVCETIKLLVLLWFDIDLMGLVHFAVASMVPALAQVCKI